MIAGLVLNMMISGGKKVAEKLDLETKNPQYYQEALLKSILKKSGNTEFGKECRFSEIQSVADYQAAVPLADYDFYSERIQRMMDGDENILTGDNVVHYNVTSGTMGNPKKIPVVEDHVSLFSRFNAQYLNYIAAKEIGKRWINGKGLSLSEGTYKLLPTGVSIGCASSLHTARMEKMMPHMPFDSMDIMYTSPKEARRPSELGVYSRYLHALFALREKNITYGNVTFSSILMELMRYIELNWEMLCDDIEHGTVSSKIDMPEAERKNVQKRLKPLPSRAAELRKIFTEHKNEPFAKLIWPKLEFFICVGGAGFQTYTDKLLDRYLGRDVHILYLGLTSSEGLYSVPLSLDSADSVFVPDGVFMEFIPVKDMTRDMSQGIKFLWELEVGKQYEIVVTNLSGLYRYELKDVIEVTGFYNKTPMMRFIGRSGFAVNVCAEKTSEKALQYTAEMTCKELNLDMYDYCVCPYEDGEGVRYVFMYELSNYPQEVTRKEIRNCTEKYLIEANPDYREELLVGNIRPTEVLFLQRETFMLYRDLMIMRGRAAAQLKPIHVTVTPYQQGFFMALEDKDCRIQ